MKSNIRSYIRTGFSWMLHGSIAASLLLSGTVILPLYVIMIVLFSIGAIIIIFSFFIIDKALRLLKAKTISLSKLSEFESQLKDLKNTVEGMRYIRLISIAISGILLGLCVFYQIQVFSIIYAISLVIQLFFPTYVNYLNKKLDTIKKNM